MVTRDKIAIDVDDVIASHAATFVAFSNQHYGTNLTVEDYHERWGEFWKVDQDEIERRAAHFHTTIHVATYGVIGDANNTLKKLAKKYDLVVMTARPEELLKPTIEWLNKDFQGIFTNMHFVPIWEPNNTVTKADICRQIGAKYLIDDLPRHCNVAQRGGIQALLFGDYGWNRSEKLEKGVVRVEDWPAVTEYFDAKS